jgi:D-aminoacyl-tRNA deacylase
MIALIQRVREAAVHVDDECIAQIGVGLLALIGIERSDDEAATQRLLNKILAYRVFSDDDGRMNRSITDVGGELLIVSQFTLVADTRTGTRPSFSGAAAPEQAASLFDRLVALARDQHGRIKSGQFGADMQVSLVNNGPVTFWLQT